jgi:hypothetical protein
LTLGLGFLRPSTTTDYILADHFVASSTSASIFPNINSVLYADSFAGADIGAKINAAYAAASSSGATIVVTGSSTMSTPVTINTSGKQVRIQCEKGALIRWTNNSATATAFTFNAGMGFTSQYGMHGCYLYGPDAGTFGVVTALELGGSNGAPNITIDGNRIFGFGTAIHTTSNIWNLTVSNNNFSYNNRLLTVDSASNSGENFKFYGNNMSDCSTITKCLYFNVNGVVNADFTDNVFDDSQAYFEDGNSTVNFVGGDFENPCFYVGCARYSYIVTGTGGYQNTTFTGVQFSNDATTTAGTPTPFILNGGNMVFNNITIQAFNSVSAPSFLLNYGGTATYQVNGYKEIGTSIDVFATSSASFYVDTVGGNVGIGSGTPSFKLGVNGTLGVFGNSTFAGNNTYVGANSFYPVSLTGAGFLMEDGGSGRLQLSCYNGVSFCDTLLDSSKLLINTRNANNVVGIGTTTPQTALDVNGTTTTNNLTVRTAVNLMGETFTNFTNYVRGLFSTTVTGLTYTAGTGVLSQTAGYNIPLTASTTNWNNFYNASATLPYYPTYTYASSTYYFASNPSGYITNAVSNLLNYPTYSYASSTYASTSWVVATFAPKNSPTFTGTSTFADIRLTGGFYDQGNQIGSLGQLLQSTGTSTRWVATSTLGINGGTTYTGSYPIIVTGSVISSGFSTSTVNNFTAQNTFTNASATAFTASSLFSTNATTSNLAVLNISNFFGPTYTYPTATGSRVFIEDGGSGAINTGCYNGVTFCKIFYDASTLLLNTRISGNTLGIGTATPLATLDVAGILNPFNVASSSGVSYFRINSNGNVGVGTTTPTQALTVAGTVQITGGAPALGKVLQSDASGIALWVATSSLGITGGTANFSTTSINGLATTTFTFSTTSDTNIGLSIATSSTGLNFISQWIGTLSDSRITSSANWNAAFASTTALTPSYIRGLLSATYPIIYNSATGIFSSGFSTSTVNVFSANNTFNASTTLASTTVTNLLVSGQTTLATASSTGLTATNLYGNHYVTGLSSSFLAVDPTGKIIATTTPSGSISGGINGFLARWTSPTTVGTGVSIDNGLVAGINATSSSFVFNVQATSTSNTNPFNVASSTGASLFTILANGNVGVGSSTPGSLLSILGNSGDTTPYLSIATSTGVSIFSVTATTTGGAVRINSDTTFADGIGAHALEVAGANGTNVMIVRNTSGTSAWGSYIQTGIAQFGTLTNTNFDIITNNGSSQVSFNATTKGTVIGGGYASSQVVPPTNGLVVEGLLSIGTSTAATSMFSLVSSAGVNPLKVASSTGASLFSVLSNGYVGIGNITPTDALQVAGNITPSVNTTWSLGSSTLRFLNLFSSNVFATSSVITNGTSTNYTTTNASSTFATSTNMFSTFMTTITGSIKHLIGGAGTPTVATSSGVGVGAGTSITITGTDLSGIIDFKTTNAPVANATIATTTFNTAYTTAPRCQLTMATSSTATVWATTTTTTLLIKSNTALAATSSYAVYYTCTQ